MAASKGRPPKLTQQAHGLEVTYGELIITALRQGAFLEHACQYANVSRSAAYGWIARGKDARAIVEEHGTTAKLTANELAFMEFADAVERARGEAVIRHLGVIRKAAEQGTWTASAWYLERTLPNHYGRQQRIEVEQTGIGSDAARAKLLALDLGHDTDDAE